MPLPVTMEFLGADRRIAIIGGGNMGRLVAEQMHEAGFPKERISIAIRGSESTRAAIEKIGFTAQSTTDCAEALRGAKLVFIGVRAQELVELKGLDFPKDGLIVVLTTGMSFKALHAITGCTNVIRAMACGHDLIIARKGIVTMCPHDHPVTTEAFKEMGYTIFPFIAEEEQVHMLSCLICSPAARVALRQRGDDLDFDQAAKFVSNNSSTPLACLKDVLEWARANSDEILWTEEKGDFDKYIGGMFTKGGLTEAVCETIRGNLPQPEGVEPKTYLAGLTAAFARCKGQVAANDELLC